MTYKPDPTYVAKQVAEKTDADWDYWKQVIPSAVEFATATVDPSASIEDKQAYLRSTLDTIEQWLRTG